MGSGQALFGALGFLGVVTALGVVANRRSGDGPLPIWMWGWLAVFATSFFVNIGENPGTLDLPAELSLVHYVLGPLIPVALWTGARIHAGVRPLPALVPAGLAVGVASAAAAGLGVPAVAHGVAFVVEPVVIVLAARTLLRAPEKGTSPVEIALPACFLALAALEAYTSATFLWQLETTPMVIGWMTVAPVVAIGQVAAASERSQVVRARGESEELHRRISELTSDYTYAVTVRDGSFRVNWIGGAFREITGYAEEELIASGWGAMVAPEDWEAAQARYQTLLDGCEIEHEIRIVAKSGEERWLRERSRGVVDEAGGCVRIYGAAQDITERKRAESARQRLGARIAATERIESLGTLAAGVAHDFNNLLTPILGQARLVLDDLPEGSPHRPRLERIVQATRYAADLTDHMLVFSGRSQIETRPLDVSSVVAGVLDLLETTLPVHAGLEADLEPGLPAVQANESQVRQVVSNLVTNAGEALESGSGTITVTTGFERVDAVRLARSVSGSILESGPAVFLEVADSGGGMSAETIARVFDPFFTTKRKGRGLGLAAVLGIVRMHEGAILVESVPGAGTKIRVLWPAQPAE